MRWACWMAVVCLGGWLVSLMAKPEAALDVFLGMLGPLVAVAGTWLAVEREVRVNPAGVSGLMVRGFVAKMAFFAVYVVVVVTVAGVDHVVFATSFAAYFVTLYAAEAMLLRRLFERLA